MYETSFVIAKRYLFDPAALEKRYFELLDQTRRPATENVKLTEVLKRMAALAAVNYGGKNEQ